MYAHDTCPLKITMVMNKNIFDVTQHSLYDTFRVKERD